MKKIFLTFCISAGILIFCANWYKTPTPKSTLDVNGDVNFRDKLSVFNPTDNSISQGNNDQILVSQGAGNPPIWKSLRIPEYEPNKFYLIFNNSFQIRQGLHFPVRKNLPMVQADLRLL
jgi:hypothetical protein